MLMVTSTSSLLCFEEMSAEDVARLLAATVDIRDRMTNNRQMLELDEITREQICQLLPRHLKRENGCRMRFSHFQHLDDGSFIAASRPEIDGSGSYITENGLLMVYNPENNLYYYDDLYNNGLRRYVSLIEP